MHQALSLCPTAVPVVGAACGAVSGAAGKLAGAGVNAVFSAASSWVASGAVWLLDEVGRVMSATTSVDLGAPWFAAHEAVMTTLAAAVVLPMVCCAAIQAVYRQSPSMLARTFLVYLPLCLVFTGVAVELVRMALALTDALSARVLSGAGVDTANLFSGLSAFFAATGAAAPAVPAFVVFVGALLVAAAALVLWLELVVRAAAVSVAVLFFPLALAALVWPAVSHWCRRLTDTLVALVLSKFVIAAVLSLAAGALAGGLGSAAGTGDAGGFASVVVGIALLLIATLSPFTLLRLVPAVEAGAVMHLESARHRVQGAARSAVRTGRSLALEVVGGPGAIGSGAADAGGAGLEAMGGGAVGSDVTGPDGGLGPDDATGEGSSAASRSPTSGVPMWAGGARESDVAVGYGGAADAGAVGAGAADRSAGDAGADGGAAPSGSTSRTTEPSGLARVADEARRGGGDRTSPTDRAAHLASAGGEPSGDVSAQE